MKNTFFPVISDSVKLKRNSFDKGASQESEGMNESSDLA